MEIRTFVRKPFEVRGVQVTEENVQEVAAWCDGKVHSGDQKNEETYIKVPTHRPLNEKQTRAYVGDWVLLADTGYKVYTQRAMENSFSELLEEDPPAFSHNVFEGIETPDSEAGINEIVEELAKEDVNPLTPEFHAPDPTEGYPGLSEHFNDPDSSRGN